MGRFTFTAKITNPDTGQTRTETGTVSNPSLAYEKTRASVDVANSVRQSPAEEIDINLRYA